MFIMQDASEGTLNAGSLVPAHEHGDDLIANDRNSSNEPPEGQEKCDNLRDIAENMVYMVHCAT